MNLPQKHDKLWFFNIFRNSGELCVLIQCCTRNSANNCQVLSEFDYLYFCLYFYFHPCLKECFKSHSYLCSVFVFASVFVPVFVFLSMFEGVKRRRGSLKSLGISASQFESQPPKNIICKL